MFVFPFAAKTSFNMYDDGRFNLSLSLYLSAVTYSYIVYYSFPSLFKHKRNRWLICWKRSQKKNKDSIEIWYVLYFPHWYARSVMCAWAHLMAQFQNGEISKINLWQWKYNLWMQNNCVQRASRASFFSNEHIKCILLCSSISLPQRIWKWKSF